MNLKWSPSDFYLFFATGLVAVYSGICVEVVTNSWHVGLTENAGPDVAKLVAKRNGFAYVMPVLGSNSEFHFLHRAVPHVRMRRSVPHTRLLKADPHVQFAVQQTGFLRNKRGYKPWLQEKQKSKILEQETQNNKQKIEDSKTKSKGGTPNNDPLYSKQWYLNNTGQAGGKPKLDLNVEEAWTNGFTGKGITTAIMDDGIDYMHPDLYDNFNAEASYDFSSNDPFPYPRYTDDWFNSHGTRCAGEIAARRGNGIGGVGVAYGSRVAGLRMLDQPYMTDLIEANSMGHEPQKIDIYSASWGPTDDGKTVDGPRNLTMKAIVYGVNEGRKGKGNIYVWASGDGGPDDDCNCDGYAGSMWTISINSATNDGQTAGYDESCSSTLASTFSNGKSSIFDAGVATTDLYGNVTTKHSGTSAAAPEAAGVFALALEANPNLTWRDMQHLVVLTSKRNHLWDPQGHHKWKINGAGIEFNHLFGYGVLDAGGITDMAKDWVNVPERFHCTGGTVQGKYPFKTNKPIILTINTDACAGQANEVNYLEHVQSFVTLNSSRRGDVSMFLTSPMKTESMILSRRPRDDDSTSGFTKWPFMTTHTWAENPRGTWQLVVTFDTDESSGVWQEGTLFEWTLMLHGMKDAPYAKQTKVDLKKHEKLGMVKKQHAGYGASAKA